MNHVKLPHPFILVQHKMDEVLGKQFKQKNHQDQFQPDGQIYPVDQPELMDPDPFKHTHGCQSEKGIDNERGRKKYKVYTGMPPFFIGESEQRKITLQYPADYQTDENPCSALPGRYVFKKRQKFFHISNAVLRPKFKICLK
jgi:hypothetical protein